MRDDLKDIATYYKNNDEDTRLARQQLEFIVTGFLLRHYLPHAGSILELGAGSGQYTVALAQEGYQVCALEMVPELLEENKKRTLESGVAPNVEFILGDARDISQKITKKFDVVLAMGPFYHLISAQERAELMKSCSQKLNDGGMLISCHLSRMGFYSYMLSQHANWLATHRKELGELFENGFIESVPRTGVFRGYYTTIDEIHSLHKESGLQLEAIHCQDPAIGGRDETFNVLSDENKLLWAEELFKISGTPLAWGSGRSLFAVGKR